MRREEPIHTNLCRYLASYYPDVIFLSDLSGIRLSKGYARKIAGLKSSRGIPDLIILKPVEEFHGLMIELKTQDQAVIRLDGRLYADEHLSEQAEVLIHLRELGYAAFFACGLIAATDLIDEYMLATPRFVEQATEKVTGQYYAPLLWRHVTGQNKRYKKP